MQNTEDTLEQLEQKICNDKKISFDDYQNFIQKTFPHLDDDTEFRKKYPTDDEWAQYKVSLFTYDQAITYLAENKKSLEFNNPDKYHMKICISAIVQLAQKFVSIGLIHGRIVVWNDIGLARISTGPYKGILFRI